MPMKKLKAYIELARIDKPIGIYLLLWPSLLGLFLASLNSNISLKNVLIVILGSLLVRSCGCVINDISDLKIDRLVQRTAGRPLATGECIRGMGILLCSWFTVTFSFNIYQYINNQNINILCSINSAVPTFQKIHSSTPIYYRDYIWLRINNCLLASI